jgi:hypothetical protein
VRTALILSLAALTATSAQAQDPNRPIRISLSVTESTGGVFQSTISSALRRLQGVEVVSPSERADYEWRVAVLCDLGANSEEKCENTTSYAVSYSVRRPLGGKEIAGWWMMGEIYLKHFTADSDYKKLRADGDSLFLGAHYFSMAILSGVARLGRSKYEQSIENMVRSFDASCLERDRITRRLTAANRIMDIDAATANLPKDICSG